MDYTMIFINKFQIFNCFYYIRVVYFAAKKREKKKTSKPNIRLLNANSHNCYSSILTINK